MIDHQGEPPETLHAAFGDFLGRHRPGDRNAPTQAPGVVSLRSAPDAAVP